MGTGTVGFPGAGVVVAAASSAASAAVSSGGNVSDAA